MLQYVFMTSHELLNKQEFKDRLTPHGYDSGALGKVFATLVRSELLFRTGLRSSDDIAYQEINQNGELEVVLSVPNLAAKMDEIRSIREIGERSVEICRHLIELSSDANPR